MGVFPPRRTCGSLATGRGGKREEEQVRNRHQGAIEEKGEKSLWHFRYGFFWEMGCGGVVLGKLGKLGELGKPLDEVFGGEGGGEISISPPATKHRKILGSDCQVPRWCPQRFMSLWKPIHI